MRTILLLLLTCAATFAQPPIQRTPLTTNQHMGPVPSDGEILKWNGTAGKWSNSVSGGSPGGAEANLQVKMGSAFVGSTNTFFDVTNNVLAIGRNGFESSITGQKLLLRSNTPIESITKRTNAPSHSYEAIRLHSGNPTNDTWWSWVVASSSNVFSVGPTYDYLMTYGFNTPSSPEYRTNEPSLGYGFESDFTTSLGVRQTEHYLFCNVNSTNTAPRIYGVDIIHNTPPTVNWTWNTADMVWNARDELSTITMTSDPTQTNSIALVIKRSGYLDFTGNTNTQQGITRFIAKSGISLFGVDTNDFTAVTGKAIGTTNLVALFPDSDASSDSLWLSFGRGTFPTARRGIRWNQSTSKMQASHNGSTWLDIDLLPTAANVTNITNYASSASAVPLTIIAGGALQNTNLLELRDSTGAPISYFQSNGTLRLPSGSSGPGLGAINFNVASSSYIYQRAAGYLTFGRSSVSDVFEILDTGTTVQSPGGGNMGYGFGPSIAAGADTMFIREGRGVVIQRDAIVPESAAQTNRIYGARTNASNGWWIEKGFDGVHDSTFLRSMANGVAHHRKLAIGVGTNQHLIFNTNFTMNIRAPAVIDVTDFVINTTYTNVDQRASVVFSVELDANTTGTAKAALIIDQAVDGAFETTISAQSTVIADPVQHVITGWLQPGARFAITNLSSGAGSPTATVVAGSTQWVRQ